jgi:hypothetical protein
VEERSDPVYPCIERRPHDDCSAFMPILEQIPYVAGRGMGEGLHM